MPRESAIVRSILTRLNGLEGAIFRKRGPGSVSGDPDIYGCYRGRHFELEVKRPGEQPTKLQQQRLSDWAETGATCAVVTSAVAAMEVVCGRQ